MPEFRVHMSTVSSFSITVEAEDYEDAIEKAYEEQHPGVCAQCSGWGREWSLDLGGPFEVDSVDQDDKEVYHEGQVWARKHVKVNDTPGGGSGV